MNHRRRLRKQDGFTLVELLIAMPLALILLAGIFTIVITAQRSERNSRLMAEALQRQQIDVERMTRELRHATSFQFLSSQKVEFDTWVRSTGTGVLRRVRYDCSSGTSCLRYEGPAGSATQSGPTTVVEALENPDVFEPLPDFVNPRYVGVIARVRIAPNRRLMTLRDGVELRNLSARY
jgi:prepilin-type N-terminal cleavage/methylation domain-containing protein